MKASVVNGHDVAGCSRPSKPAARSSTGLTRDDLLRVYRCMLLSRKLDDKEIQLKHQSQIFFQISGAGHEAILVAAGMVLKPAYDWFYPYYRDRALCLQLGVTPLEMLLAAVGAKDDPSSHGRQMPSHWGHRRLNIVSGSSADRHAGPAGRGRRRRRRHLQPRARDSGSRIAFIRTRSSTRRSARARRAKASSGKRSTPLARGQLPVLFLVEDNGYAISVPVEVQTRRRRHLAARAIVPRPARRIGRRHRFPRAACARCARPPPTCARARARRSSTRTSSARTRTRCPTTRSCTRRRRSARRKRARDPLKRFSEFLLERGSPPTAICWRRSAPTSTAR